MNDSASLYPLLPEGALALTILVVISVDLFLARENKWWLTPLTVVGLGLTAGAIALVWNSAPTDSLAGIFTVDHLALVLKLAAVGIAALAALFCPSYLVQRRLPLGEFNAILLFSTLGIFVLSSSADLITLFLGLELMVMPAYLLTGFHKTDRFSNEGALKYFLLGSFASAILLFGVAWIYGLTGSTKFVDIAQVFSDGLMNSAVLVAIAFLTVGATFKVAAVPFHFWTPDAYQGAPTPITGFLSVGPKLGAFALLLRLFGEALGPLRADWVDVFAILAVVTMTFGNVVALTQTNVKRMLAYSSIAHTGYILAGLVAYAAATDPAVATSASRGGRLLPGGVRGHEHRRLRGGGHAPARPTAIRWAGLLRRPRVAPTRPGRGHDRPAPVTDRYPAHGRVLRQALHPAVHRECGPRVAGGGHCIECSPGRVLLPSGRGLHVHA